MESYNIMGIFIEKRDENSVKVQKILTENGCSIRARLGLPQQGAGECTDKGLLILQMYGKKEQLETVKKQLNDIPGVYSDYMIIKTK